MEIFLKDVVEQCGGVCGTLAEAVEELAHPRLKKVRPVPSYRGTLTLGEYLKGDTAMNLEVERYPRTMIAKPMSASSFVQKSKPEEEERGGPSVKREIKDEGEDDKKMSYVKNERTYQVKDETEEGGKKEVQRDELEKGYMYGRAVVPISSTDESITTLETESSYEILGFVPRQGVSLIPPALLMEG